MNDDMSTQTTGVPHVVLDTVPQARSVYQGAQDEIAKAQGMPERDVRRVQEKAFRQIIATSSPEICDAIASMDQTFRRLWHKTQVEELKKDTTLSEYAVLQKQNEIYQALQQKALAAQSIDASWYPRSIREERRRSYLKFIDEMNKTGKHDELISLAGRNDPYLQKLLDELEGRKVRSGKLHVVPAPQLQPEVPLESPVVVSEGEQEVTPVEKPSQPSHPAIQGQEREDLWERKFGQPLSEAKQKNLADASDGRMQHWVRNLGVSVMIATPEIEKQSEPTLDTVPAEPTTMVQVPQTLESVTPDVKEEQPEPANPEQLPDEPVALSANENGSSADEVKNESADTKGRGFLSRLFGRG